MASGYCTGRRGHRTFHQGGHPIGEHGSDYPRKSNGKSQGGKFDILQRPAVVVWWVVPCGGCGSSCFGGNAVPGGGRRRSWGRPVLHDGRGWSGETREGDVSRCLALLSAWRVRKSARVGSGHWGLREPFPDVAKLHHNPWHQRAINTAHLHAHRF